MTEKSEVYTNITAKIPRMYRFPRRFVYLSIVSLKSELIHVT